ncbi:VOC family protein [Flavobacterium macacae]|uniref:Glyoxalase n=1 Tax=Flavobacterium macacae TaxID=2488993 RepID=A0A3P3WAE5_9FLAO|nr:glyoxalase [Flavobacterium macacae]RRJ92125.1 glyoxalase [Flavobacterium macacae]
MKAISLRPFIGAKNFTISRNFYRDLGFEEIVLSNTMSVFKKDEFAFYLQDAYVKDWIDNTMLFLEVENAEECYQELSSLNLPAKYEDARLSPIQHNDWGSECFVHDPSGILWHFGEFSK